MVQPVKHYEPHNLAGNVGNAERTVCRRGRYINWFCAQLQEDNNLHITDEAIRYTTIMGDILMLFKYWNSKKGKCNMCIITLSTI